MVAVVLALLSSVSWGTADFIAGVSSRRASAVLVLLVQQFAGWLIAVAVLAIAGDPVPSGDAIWLSLAAGAAGAIALGAFYRALAVGTMSVVAPISASGVTLPVAFGIVTGDRPGAVQAVGLVLAVAGVVLASREVHEGEQASAARTSILLALVAAAGFGLFFTAADGAADESVLWLLVISRGLSVLMLAVLLAMRGGVEVPPVRSLAPLLLVGALDLAATGLYAVATTKGLLSVVSVVGALYPVMTVLLARIVLDERLRAVQATGVALAVLGVAAVAAGT